MKYYVAGLAFGTVFAFPLLASADAPKHADVKHAGASAPTHVHRVFDVMRSGSKIGSDTIDVTRNGDLANVKITTHIVVKIAFITAYRFDHTETQTWKGNQLTAFKSTTDDNGKPHELSAAQAGGKLTLTVDGTPNPVPKAIAPATLWFPDISKHPQLFDVSSGKRMESTGSDLGEETVEINGAPQQLHHVKLSGDFDRDLWFDDQGLVKMSMLGSDNSEITSQLRTTTASR